MANITTFNSLPKGVVQEIFLYVGPESMSSCSLVCKKWNAAMKDNYFLERINKDYIHLCNSHKEYFSPKAIDPTMLSKACVNTIPWYQEKIDQFFCKLFLSENGTRKYWCFLRNPDMLFKIEGMRPNEQLLHYNLTIIPTGNNKADTVHAAFCQIGWISGPEMITSSLHRINLALELVLPNSNFEVTSEIKENLLSYLTELNAVCLNHLDTIESRWLGVDPGKIAIYNVTVHQETAFGESICILGTGARVWNVSQACFENLKWERSIILEWTEGHNWTCKLQRLSESLVEFKIVFSSFLPNTLNPKWEIIDDDPLKNRVINLGDNTNIHIDNLIFQK